MMRKKIAGQMPSALLVVIALVGVQAGNAASSAFQDTARPQKTLADAVKARPFREFSTWWPLGARFSAFMSEAIVGEWSALAGNDGNLAGVKAATQEYVKTVYGREARPLLVDDFVAKRFSTPLQSGEFDALSYAFFRAAFDLIARHPDRYTQAVEVERRAFTRRVGKAFFGRAHDHLRLTLPARLQDEASLAQLKSAIETLGAFLKSEGYVRDHFAFRFTVSPEQSGGKVTQSEAAFLEKLERRQPAYALYEMGYPVILPSAVYLFNTVGEAQHHSSRTIEELFDRVGCAARETSDFDPSGYPSDMVVELWTVSAR